MGEILESRGDDMGLRAGELGKKGDFGIPVGRERQDGDHADFDRCEEAVSELRLIRELEDHDVIRFQSGTDKMQRQPIDPVFHLAVGDVSSVTSKSHPTGVISDKLIELLTDRPVDPVALLFVLSDERFRIRDKTLQHCLLLLSGIEIKPPTL